MRLNVAVPEAQVNKPVLDAALEAVTRLNESLLKDGSVPTAKEAISKGVRWKPEPYDSEHFDHAAIVMRRGWGDCDDLAPYHAASLRHTGEDPEARAVVRRSGPKRWHAYVERSNGDVDDPSRWAGMGKRDDSSVRGASLALMYHPPSSVSGPPGMLMPAMSLRPDRGEWGARVDIPWFERQHGNWHPTDYAMASLARNMHPMTSLVKAIEGACKVGLCAGFAHPQNVNRLAALADACEGVGYEDLAALYGEEHAVAATELVGSLWGKIKKVAKSAARTVSKAVPVAKTALRFVPGAGQALAAYDVAKGAYDAGKKIVRASPADLLTFGVHPNAVPLLVRAGFPVR